MRDLRMLFELMVGMTGLEPATSCTPCMRSGQLSYIPRLHAWYAIKNREATVIFADFRPCIFLP